MKVEIIVEALQADYTKQPLTKRYLKRSPKLAFSLFSALTVSVLVYAWLVRDYHYIRAESGLGYLLGIVGASLMVILLLYPLRKRLRFMRGWLQIKSWFRLHMILGVLGPLCILLHSNFQLGSTNSSIALSAMLLVAGSGLIGRYLYGKFHYGLYGRQVRLEQIKADLDGFYQQIAIASLSEPQQKLLRQLYHGSCKIIDNQQQQVSLRQLLQQRRWLSKMKRRVLRAKLERQGVTTGSPSQALHNHFRALALLMDRLAGLRLFERLFWLWHVVHIPVFILMILTATVHIIVVHWY